MAGFDCMEDLINEGPEKAMGLDFNPRMAIKNLGPRILDKLKSSNLTRDVNSGCSL